MAEDVYYLYTNIFLIDPLLRLFLEQGICKYTYYEDIVHLVKVCKLSNNQLTDLQTKKRWQNSMQKHCVADWNNNESSAHRKYQKYLTQLICHEQYAQWL